MITINGNANSCHYLPKQGPSGGCGRLYIKIKNFEE